MKPMINYGGKIGNVVGKGGGRWEWRIPKFSKLPRGTCVYYQSHVFDVDGLRWVLRIELNWNRIKINLLRTTSWEMLPKSCTMGVKRADHSEKTIGTKTCGDYHGPCVYYFDGTMDEIENGDWLVDGQLTITCLIRDKDASQEFGNFTSPESQTYSLDGRLENCTCSKSKANRKVTSRETQTDVKIGKNEKLEDGTFTGAKGARRLIENLKGLLTENNKNYDARIFVKGKEFRAHKCILEARSPVLGMMLTHDSKEKNSGEIHIEDCDPDCFDAFLLFVYCGRTENLTTSRALSLYYAADKYDLPDLKEECVHFLKASLSATSVCDVVHLAARHGEEQLLRIATEYFVKNMKTILFTVEWQNFMVQNSTVANELLIKSCQSKHT